MWLAADAVASSRRPADTPINCSHLLTRAAPRLATPRPRTPMKSLTQALFTPPTSVSFQQMKRFSLYRQQQNKARPRDTLHIPGRAEFHVHYIPSSDNIQRVTRSRKLPLRKHDQHYRLFKIKGLFETKSVMQEFMTYNRELAEFPEYILCP